MLLVDTYPCCICGVLADVDDTTAWVNGTHQAPECAPSLPRCDLLTCVCAGSGDRIPGAGHACGRHFPPAEEWHAHHGPAHVCHEQGACASLSGVVCGLMWCSAAGGTGHPPDQVVCVG